MIDQVWMLRRGAFSPVDPHLQGGVPMRFTLWGIVNATPDSFYDGNRHASATEAIEHALKLRTNGARILDIGGASTRPGAEDIPAHEELSRIMPVIRALNDFRIYQKDEAMLLSIDTWQASVAAAALENGADIINDVSGFAWDPSLPDVLAQYNPGYVLTHCPPGTTPRTMQAPPRYDNLIDDTCSYFDQKLNMLVSHGFSEKHVMLDPGIGFGKSLTDNIMLLSRIELFFRFGRPILIGLSNKSMFQSLLGLSLNERSEATAVSTAILAGKGVLHHRVHDVAGAKNALVLTESLTGRMEP